MTPDDRVRLDGLIRQFVDDLFTNGQGQQADRLVLTVDGPPKRDLGGWGRLVITDKVRALLVLGDARPHQTEEK